MINALARIEVRNIENNLRSHPIAQSARKHLKIPVLGAESFQLYWLGSENNIRIPREELDKWTQEVFTDPVLQVAAYKDEQFSTSAPNTLEPKFVVEVRFRPGVTDNIGTSATEALKLCSKFAVENDIRAYSGSQTLFFGEINRAQAEQIGHELLGNSLLHEINVYSWKKFKQSTRFSEQSLPIVDLGDNSKVKEVNLDVDNHSLEQMSKDNCWALTVEELHQIWQHYASKSVQDMRKQYGLGVKPTDVEIEVFAQTWSEHCKHKIFAADITYSEKGDQKSNIQLGKSFGDRKLSSLYKTFIKGATEKIRKDRNLDWLISVFSDNAGIVRFDENLDLCIKVETHNSPSALDPYGGSLTGIVGVNRDILGCGIGSRPIANTDVFCFAPPNWPAAGQEKELPEGLKHPRRILEGVHLGVEDGGNKSGIPTVNGAIYFHKNYAGKPLVFCGTIGALPQKLKSGIATHEKRQKAGDHIIMAGGRIGKDGIHGATFSSLELDKGAPATAVQIGDPITQKRLSDFLLEARDKELFSSITDNGAGGLSSSVGEMAQETNGARIDVALAPVKYPGLSPYELTISESQERMTFAVPEENLAEFLALAERRGVEATNIGQFTNDGYFHIQHKGTTVALLDLDFLHDGLLPMQLKACWTGRKKEKHWYKKENKIKVSAKESAARPFFEQALQKLLSSWNIRSKENLVRRYDHEVQAATLIKPFVGKNADGPSDASVIWLAPHGGSEEVGVSVGCGLAPKHSYYDGYLMAKYALDEAVRNCVAVGGDPDQIALIDNFCWPDPVQSKKTPDGEYKLAQLVRACAGLYDSATIYGAPFVSGKDSMKNDYTGLSRFGKEVKISIPPTVLVTAMAKVSNIAHTVSSDFKQSGDKVYTIGNFTKGLGASELIDHFDIDENVLVDEIPSIDLKRNLKLYRSLHKAMQSDLLSSCHDCSEGGLLVALAESALGGHLGLQFDIENINFENDNDNDNVKNLPLSKMEFFFNEASGRFVVSVAPGKEAAFLQHFSDEQVFALGEVSEQKIFRITEYGMVILDASLSSIQEAWKGAFH